MTIIKNLIPFVFAAIIIGFIVKLGADNRQLRISNASLTAESKQLNVKNNDLATTLQNLTDAVTDMNKLVDKEAKRRAAAEMKSQKLQEEVKDALKDNKCSIELIPDSVIEQLRRQADSIRSGKDTEGSNSGKPSR
jgi:peptidoglycan hydrolase CwlO-like protein